MKTFTRGGITFRYPSTWALDRDESGGGWTASVQSTGTAFLVVSLQPDAETPIRLAGETLAALRAEYPGLEADEAVEPVAGLPAVGHDVEFLTLDTTTTCWTRCLDTADGPLLVMAQVGDYDRADNLPVLRAIQASLVIAEE